jgi:pimeloyl-ACP methyl ester carboxylesterase
MNGNFLKRKMRSLSGRRKKFIIILSILIIITVVLYYEHSSIYAIPKSRISLNEYYPELKEDSFNHYINLPIDYNDPGKGKYRGFYLFSPNFYKSKNIIFLLTDGQMELVNTETDFDFFEKVLKGSAYVLMGVRGHSPTFFHEVYKNGGVDYEMATKLYNSDQEIEDIEQVRLDLIKKGILAEGCKINIFGASGAGVLAQQYVSKYGANVNRVILESTGAPDLAADSGLKYSPDFKDFNPNAAIILDSLLAKRKADKATICNILYQVGRSERSPREAQLKILEQLQRGGSLFKYYFNPITNISVLNYMIKSPKEIAARIRWFELVGKDLMGYASQKETNLLYELSSVAVSDLLEYHKQNHIPAKVFKINRSHFSGEVLLLKGTEDEVFSDSLNRVIEQQYPNARILFFKDGHRMQNDKEHYMKIRSAFFAGGFKAREFLNLVNQH